MASHLKAGQVRPHQRALRCTAQAYALAYISSTGPRILRVLISLQRKDVTVTDAIASIRRILQLALQTNRFPAFCGTIVGLSTILPRPLQFLLEAANTGIPQGKRKLGPVSIRLLATFLATLIASSASFSLLNGAASQRSTVQTSFGEPVISVTESEPALQTGGKKRSQSKIPDGLPALPPEATLSRGEVFAQGIPLAGRTMDLTLFALVRALDVLVQSRWPTTRPPRSTFSALLRRSATPALFVLSSATIMYAFFYMPTRLPYTYVKWINRMAELDERLLHALRQARYGNFIYGKDTGLAPLLGSMAKDYEVPEVWGDPAKTVPVPCELVHHCKSKSCELHAAWRLWRGVARAAAVYLPLSAIVLIRKLRAANGTKPGGLSASRANLDVIRRILLDSARSSAFLGAFIALFYYGVCLTRTRIGPRVFSRSTVTPQMYDSGLGVLGGCTLCGWSILLENSRRRTELMLFVLPRAFAVVAPRRYPKQYLWREHVTFALSAAIVLTAVKEQPEKVRGVFGRVLRAVLA